VAADLVDMAAVVASSALRTHKILAVTEWADRAWVEVVAPDREWAWADAADRVGQADQVVAEDVADRVAEAPAALVLHPVKIWAHKAWAADRDFAAVAADRAAVAAVVAVAADRMEP
jgi:hypothetical protein